MTETVEKPKRRGNPNLGKRKETVSTTGPKRGIYVFKLLKSHESLKPVNNITQEIDDNPYPHMYIAANSGVAWDEERGEERRWRYLYGYSSIWEEDQVNPKPDVNRLTNSDGKNDIVFLKGFLKVRAGDTAKLKALQVNDGFEGNTNKVNNIPDVFELVDADKAKMAIRNAADRSFAAESAARKLEGAELLGVALALGIDVNDPDLIDDVRSDVIARAKAEADNFMKIVNDPRHKIKYMALRGLNEGLITTVGTTLSYQGTPWLQINPNVDVAHQISSQVLGGDKKAKELYDSLLEYYNV